MASRKCGVEIADTSPDMFARNLLCAPKKNSNLTVVVRLADLDFPQSEEEMHDTLLAHAVDCHECLEAILFRDQSLAEYGCRQYKKLYADMTSELNVQTSITCETHLSDAAFEEFCFDRLSEAQLKEMEQHVLACAECAARLHERQTFFFWVKAAVKDRAKSAAEVRITGVVGVNAPEAGLSVCSAIEAR